MALPEHLLFLVIGLSSEKTYGDAHSKTGKLSNLVNGPIPWNDPPRLEKFLNSFLSSGSKVVELTPPGSDIWWTFLKFYLCMYCPVMHANLP